MKHVVLEQMMLADAICMGFGEDSHQVRNVVVMPSEGSHALRVAS